MGIVASGTNNARLAGMLRNLAQFYHKEPADLFMVRIAQVREGVREGGREGGRERMREGGREGKNEGGREGEREREA